MATCLSFAGVALAILTPAASWAVVGGRPVSIRAAPWTVEVAQEGRTNCNGVIVDAKHILTAAHCVWTTNGVRLPASKLEVLAGVSNVNDYHSPDAQLRLVASVYVMPGYRNVPITHDNQVRFAEHDLAVL